MAYFEREDALRMATPNIALNGRSVPLRIRDGFGSPILYDLPSQTMLVAPGIRECDDDFISMDALRDLLARSMGIFLPSIYQMTIKTRDPLTTVGVNAYFAPQLIEAAFNVWGGVARLRDPQSTGMIVVDNRISSEYILRRDAVNEMQFVIN